MFKQQRSNVDSGLSCIRLLNKPIRSTIQEMRPTHIGNCGCVHSL